LASALEGKPSMSVSARMLLSVALLGFVASVVWSSAIDAAPLSQAYIERLVAAGLSPSDPSLSTKLAALAAKRIAEFRHTAANLRALRFRAAVGSAANLNEGSLAVIKSPSPTPRSIGQLRGGVLHAYVPPPPPPVITGANASLGLNSLDVNGNNFKPTDNSLDIVTLDLGSCGRVTIQVPQGFTRDTSVFPRVNFDSTNVDSQPFSAKVQISVQGVTSPAFQFHVNQLPHMDSIDAAIAATSPHLSGDAGIGLTEGTSVVYSTNVDRLSTDPYHGQGGNGEDTLGRGIFLLNGYTATAKIISAQSYMDNPNYEAPTDSNRGATVDLHPQNGRLETHIAWFYRPGESISYALEWTLHGPRGLRPLSSLPKGTTCAGEQ
jgi:hypothetical protein